MMSRGEATASRTLVRPEQRAQRRQHVSFGVGRVIVCRTRQRGVRRVQGGGEPWWVCCVDVCRRISPENANTPSLAAPGGPV